MSRFALLLCALVACGEHKPLPANTAPATTTSASHQCSDQIATMKTFMRSGNEPTSKPPWPTRDATADKRIDELRAETRKAMDPAGPAPKLAEKPARPSRIEAELAACRESVDRLPTVGRTDTRAGELAAWDAVFDALASCDCKADLAYVRAMLYIGAHPDAG
jgi:hypothetical protein